MIGAPNQTPDVFAWDAHPLRERLSRALVAGAVILAIAVGVWLTTGDRFLSILAPIVLVLSLNRFFFPSRFEIDEEGITARYPLRTRRCQWRHLRRFVHDENGGYLSTRAVSSRLDAYGGVHVLFGRHREAVISRIRSFMQQGGPSCAG